MLCEHSECEQARKSREGGGGDNHGIFNRIAKKQEDPKISNSVPPGIFLLKEGGEGGWQGVNEFGEEFSCRAGGG